MEIEYTLLHHGDAIERAYHDRFIGREFQNYERFWKIFVIPLTNRPNNIRFKTEEKLKEVGRSYIDVWMAQLHYTVLFHLSRAYDILHDNDLLDVHQFIDAILRLSSATDVADELLERYTNPGEYKIIQNKGIGGNLIGESKKARNSWRSKNEDLKGFRYYRNTIVHSIVIPRVIFVPGTLGQKVPKIGRENKYLDWRIARDKIANGEDIDIEDFDYTSNVMANAWRLVLTYLQDQWGRHLL